MEITFNINCSSLIGVEQVERLLAGKDLLFSYTVFGISLGVKVSFSDSWSRGLLGWLSGFLGSL